MKHLLLQTRGRSFHSSPASPGLPFTGILLFCLTFVILTGCKKDFNFDKVKKLSWNPDIAVAVVHDSLTVQKALVQTGTEDRLYIDESGDISILYYMNKNAFRFRPNDLIQLPPVSFVYLHPVTQSEHDLLAGSDLTLPPELFSFNLAGNSQGVRVDKLLIKKGFVKVTTNHTFSNSGFLSVKILNATKQGVPFSFTVGPFTPGPTVTNIDLSGVFFDFSSSPNMVSAEIQGFLKKSDKPVAGDEIRADFLVTVDTIGRFEGFLGQHSFPQLEDTVRIPVFNNAFAQGNIYFVDPQASITLVNSIGVPVDITIEKMLAINNASGNTLDIADRLGAGTYISIPSPLITATLPVVKTMYYTNANTGNAMYDFYNLKPDNIAFQISLLVNPTGTPLNFFSDTSSFHAELRAKLPLYGHFDHLVLQDTFDLSLERPEELEHLEFRTNIINGIPLTAFMQVYFTDEFYNKKDSLTGKDQLIIKEAPVDPATFLPYPGQYGVKDTTFILDMARMKNLETVKKVLVKAVLHSSNEGHGNVKLRANQMLNLSFSTRVKLRIPINTSK
jgi:hypothetical protein